MATKFQMDLVIITAVEQFVCDYAMQKTMQKFPQCLDETEQLNEDRSLYYDHTYEQAMDNMTVTLQSPIWPTMKLPLVPQTLLKLESTYVEEA